MDKIEAKPTDKQTLFSTRLTELEQLESFIDKRVSELLSIPKDLSESEDVTKICAALAKAQGMFPNISANRSGYFENSNFSDLHCLVKAVQPALDKNELSITGQIDTIDGKEMLTMKLRHSSGQFIRSRIRIVTSDSIPEYKETIADMKRESFKTLLNLTEDKDPSDNDSATATQREEDVAMREGYTEAQTQYETISIEAEEEIRIELLGHKDIAKFLMKSFKIKNIGDLPKKHFHIFLHKVKENKKAQLGE